MNGTLMCDAELEILEFDGLAGIAYDTLRLDCWCRPSIQDPAIAWDE